MHNRVAHPKSEQYRRIAGDWRSWIADDMRSYKDWMLNWVVCMSGTTTVYRLDDIKWHIIGK